MYKFVHELIELKVGRYKKDSKSDTNYCLVSERFLGL